MQPLCHDDESYALLQFKESLVINESASYEPSANSKVASWKVDGESGDCCSWDGVECDGDSGHVIGLDLSSSCLYGSIDSNSSLFHLVQLRRLNLADNDFNNSEITSEIRNLSRLFDLNLSMSVFSGVIPSSLGNLTKLNYLDLCDNFFSGKIPPSLVNLFQLTYLSLSHNNFTSGTLHWLCNLTKLNCVGLAGTNSYGEIPSCLGNLTQLTELKLDSNELTGQIPTWIGNRTQLITLALGDNKLHGPISDSIFRLPNLESLHLLENLFSGTVELGLLKSRSLVSFQLSDNNLSVIGNHNDSAALQKIQILSLSGCNLSGEFPSFLHGQNHLEFVELGGNKIEGHIPTWFMLDGALPIPPHSTIIYLVSDNRLNGEIPPAICNLTSLVILQLSNNNLSGKLPQCLGNISNSASGKIPKSLANCPKLEILNIEQNKINDVFPSWLGILPELRVLILRSNRLHGVIGKPKADFEFQRLQIVDLSGNCFLGKLPLEYFRNWTAMKTIYTEHPLYMQVDASFQLPRYVMTYHFDYSMTMTYHP
ncbi:hypothetical protein NC651_035865 [Populus alba x Populus x berolinensis]|nr:hypothetical protein NC651_035865 [Populus alba x Populus x berolinensis]